VTPPIRPGAGSPADRVPAARGFRSVMTTRSPPVARKNGRADEGARQVTGKQLPSRCQAWRSTVGAGSAIPSARDPSGTPAERWTRPETMSSTEHANRALPTAESDPMTTNISTSTGNENFHNTADDAGRQLDIMACPECSLTAAVQHWDWVKSTDGPIEHVKMTCVNRHWFLMSADRLH
jgi:hypothetical protein